MWHSVCKVSVSVRCDGPEGDLLLSMQASEEQLAAGGPVDEGSSLLSTHEQEEAFLIDTSTSNGNSPSA